MLGESNLTFDCNMVGFIGRNPNGIQWDFFFIADHVESFILGRAKVDHTFDQKLSGTVKPRAPLPFSTN